MLARAYLAKLLRARIIKTGVRLKWTGGWVWSASDHQPAQSVRMKLHTLRVDKKSDVNTTKSVRVYFAALRYIKKTEEDTEHIFWSARTRVTAVYCLGGFVTAGHRVEIYANPLSVRFFSHDRERVGTVVCV